MRGEGKEREVRRREGGLMPVERRLTSSDAAIAPQAALRVPRTGFEPVLPA